MSTLKVSVHEYGSAGKDSNTTVNVAALTAGNFADQMSGSAALVTAIEAVIVGTVGNQIYNHLVSAGTPTAPVTPLAQRENKWLVSAHESSAGFNPVSFTIPCADLTLVGPDGETMDISAGVGLALVDAIEGFVTSNDGVAITVDSIKFRGRTL